MANASTYLSDVLINHLLRNAAYPSPLTNYLALFTSDAGLEGNDSGVWTEVNGGNYARVALDSAVFSNPVDGVTDNAEVITYPTATGDWGTVTHAAIMDSATGGNVLIWLPLSLAKAVSTGDSVVFLAQDLDIAIS